MSNLGQIFRRAAVFAVLALTGTAIGCRGRSSSPPSSAPVAAPPTSETQAPPVSTHQQGPPILPDPQRTPGATLAVSTDDVCVPGYTQQVRDVPAGVKRRVYAEYGITHHQPGEYEVDHLISLELGGSNSVKNLWPQSYETEPWNAHVKDALEDELHREVCSGQLDLKTAQRDIAGDWIKAYKQYFHTDQPLASTRVSRRRRRQTAGDPSGGSEPPASAASAARSSNPDTGAQPEVGQGARVWVNTRSGKYFGPGSRYYGQTSEGEYMTAAEARRQGYVAAQGD